MAHLGIRARRPRPWLQHSQAWSSTRGIPKCETVGGASMLAGANLWCTEQVCRIVQVPIPQRDYATARLCRWPSGHWKHPCCMRQACWTAQAFMLHAAKPLYSAGILGSPSWACDAEQAVLSQRVCCQCRHPRHRVGVLHQAGVGNQ